MGDISNEVLMAYVDGELDAAARVQVEAELVRSPALRKRVETFRATREPFRTAFDHVMREPVPQHLVDLVRNLGRSGAESASNVVTIGSERQRVSAASAGRSAWPFRLAAGVALMLLAGGSGWLLRGTGETPGQSAAVTGQAVALARTLQRALETAPSLRDVAITEQGKALGSLRVKSTFFNQDQAYCRDYELDLDTAERFRGFACRRPSGDWTIEQHARGGGEKATPKSLAPAKGPSSSKDAHAAAIEAAMIGGRLDEHEEQLLLKSGWKARLPQR